MNRFCRHWARLAVLVIAICATAVGAIRLDQYASTVHEFQLANGLKVILIEDHGAPLVTVGMTARGGYADDPKGMRGISFLVPTMLEQGPGLLGSRNLTEERAAIKAMNAAHAEWSALALKPGASALYDRLRAETKWKMTVRTADSFVKPRFSVKALEYYGAQGFRAVVSPDYIEWSARLPSNRVDAFLLLYGEWLRQPLPRLVSLTKEVIGKQFADEFLTEDSILRRALLSLAYGPSGYGLPRWDAAGMERVHYSDVEPFLKSRFSPSNLVLTLAGDLTPESARSLAEEYMSKIPPSPAPALELPKPPALQELRAAPPKETPAAVVVAYRRPPDSDPDDPVMDILEEILLEGPTSRFRTGFMAAHPMLTSHVALASTPGSRQGGLMLLVIPYHRAKSPQDWVQLIAGLLEESGKSPLPENLIAAARRRLEGRLLAVYADPQLAAQHLGRMGSWAKSAQLAEAWSRVTPADLQRVAAKYLRPELRVILQPGYVPGAAPAAPSKPDAPKPDAPKAEAPK